MLYEPFFARTFDTLRCQWSLWNLNDEFSLADSSKSTDCLWNRSSVVVIQAGARQPVELKQRYLAHHHIQRMIDLGEFQAERLRELRGKDVQQVEPCLALDAFKIEQQWTELCSHGNPWIPAR